MQSAQQNQNDTQNRAAISVLVFLFALTVRMVNLLVLQHAPFFSFKIGDAARYDAWAKTIANGDFLGEGIGVFYQAPLYPYFLSSIYAILGDDIMTVRKVQALLGAVSCVLLMNAAWNLFNRRAAIAAGIVMSLYVPSIFLETMIQKSVLDLFFICLIAWLVSKINLQEKLNSWIALGITVGALCLTRENALALVPAFLIWAIVFRWQRDGAVTTGEWFRCRARYAAIFLLGLSITLGPVALRNYFMGGELQLTTSQLGPNFYIGNNPESNGSYKPLKAGRGDAKFEQADAVAIAESESGRKLTPNEVSSFYLRKSASYIKNDPLAWISLLGKKALMSVNAIEIIDTEDQYVYQDWSPLLKLLSFVFNFGVLCPLAIFGLWYSLPRWREFWILHVTIGLFQATMIVFFVFGRYRFPIVPLLILFAAPVIANLFICVRNSMVDRQNPFSGLSRGKLSATFVVTTCLLIICHLPIISTKVSRATTLNNFGVQMLLRGELGEAEQYFVESISLAPQDALAHNNLGVTYREQEKYQEAATLFRKAIDLAPTYENPRKNLEKLEKQFSL